MKKILLSVAVVSSLFTACQKDDTSPNSTAANSSRVVTPNGSAISPVPSTFVTRVLAEEYVGTQYGLTPEATRDLHLLSKSYGNRICSVSLHVNDVMTTYQTGANLRTLNSSPSFPSGTINRCNYNGALFMDSKDYNAAVNARLQRNVPCGLAIYSTANGNASASIEVHAGFSGVMTGNYRVMTYIIEDQVTNSNPAFSQNNSMNNFPNSVFQNAGNPISNFIHYNVLRRCISGSNGDAISNTNIFPGGEQVFNYRIDLPAHLSPGSRFMIVSFIIDANTHEVINVQQAELNTTKDWN